jgi:DNA-binding NarL/FixJ family response regulator
MKVMMKSGKVRRPSRGARVYAVNLDGAIWEDLARALSQRADVPLRGVVINTHQLLRELESINPDLVLVDVFRSGGLGLRFVRRICSLGKFKILALSNDPSPESASRALAAGADGYVLEDEEPEDVAQAVHDVIAGQIYLSEEVLDTPEWRRFKPATSRRALGNVRPARKRRGASFRTD